MGYIPSSCCDSNAGIACNSLNSYRTIYDSAGNFDPPVYKTGCLPLISSHVERTAYKTLLGLICLDLLISIGQIVLYHLSRRFVLAYMQSSPTNDSRNPGYISEEQLLLAVQGIQLISHLPVHLTPNAKVRKQDIDKLDLGWVHGTTWLDTKATYLHRWNSKYSRQGGTYSTSRMRRFFRKYLPFVEALLYADGNVFHDPDGNSAYRSYLVYLTRILFSAVYGLVMAIILSYAFIPNPSNIVAPVEASGASKSPAFSAGKQGKPDAEDLRKGRSTWEQKAETARVSTTRRLFLIARVLLYFAFSLASTMSRRVRCFLTLLVPSLGLSAGQSFMAAELLYITVTGPVTTITRNLQSGASTLECLMELSNNMTRDLHRMGTADLFNMEGELEMMDPKESDDDEWDGLNELSAKSQKLTTLFSRMTERIVKEFTTKLKKGVNVLESTVSSMQQMLAKVINESSNAKNLLQENKVNYAVGDESEIVAKSDEEVEREFSQYLEEIDISEREMWQQHVKKSSERYTKHLKDVNIERSTHLKLNMTLKIGGNLEQRIRFSTLSLCTYWKQLQAKRCNLVVAKICNYAKSKFYIFFRFLNCFEYVGSRVSCSARADVDVTKKECSMAPEFSGHQGGVVSRLMLMKDRLQMMSNLSHLKTGVRQISELSKPVFTLAGTVVQSTSNLVATTRSFFRSAQAVIALLASLLKLIILMVLFKANAYITGYLHDSDFDNIYVDDYFEQLDWRRVRQGREGLLPLHRVENKRFIWHTKRYTKSEFKKACMALLKASLLVTSVMLILMGNKYIYDLMIILDKSADISVNLETGTSQQRELTSPKTSGDGLLVKLFTNIISKVMRLSQVRLDYGLSSCRPRTHRLPPEVVFRIMLLSLVILILGGISGYLLRLRHHILDFFYPARFRRRTLYLYNAMLVDRKRRETVAKNVLLQRIRQNLLQAVVVDQFVRKKKLIESQMTSMIKVKQTKWIKKWLLNRKSLKCLVCQETFPVGSNLLRVCPVDGSVICKVCQRNLLLSDDTSDCISCADQDLGKMIALARKLEPEYHDEDKDNLNFRKKEVKQKH